MPNNDDNDDFYTFQSREGVLGEGKL